MSSLSRDYKTSYLEYACTLDEVAEALGISRQGAQQLEISALNKLRKAGVLDHWADYVGRLRNLPQEM